MFTGPRCAVALLCAASATALAAPGDMFVTSDFTDTTNRYDGLTGNMISPFTSSFLGGSGQLGFHHSLSMNRALIGHFGGGVQEFDLTTGSYIKSYGMGGGTTWAGVYAPSGEVLMGDWATNDIRRYDSASGAFLGVLTPNIDTPADMRFGPNGNLYVCSFNNMTVSEINPNTGLVVSSWNTPFGTRPNDLAFMPDGRIIVTTMDFTNGPGPGNRAWVYDSGYNLIANFVGAGWGRVHGIDISPLDGNIYIADGITAQVHVFDSTTYAELNSAFCNPHPIGKIVDVEFEVIPAPGALLAFAGLLGLGRRRR
jgi:DNA-binding beta-propeller fold protein YncE